MRFSTTLLALSFFIFTARLAADVTAAMTATDSNGNPITTLNIGQTATITATFTSTIGPSDGSCGCDESDACACAAPIWATYGIATSPSVILVSGSSSPLTYSFTPTLSGTYVFYAENYSETGVWTNLANLTLTVGAQSQTVSIYPTSPTTTSVQGTLNFTASAKSNGADISNSNGGYAWSISPTTGVTFTVNPTTNVATFHFTQTTLTVGAPYIISVSSPGNANYLPSGAPATATVIVKGSSAGPQKSSLSAIVSPQPGLSEWFTTGTSTIAVTLAQ